MKIDSYLEAILSQAVALSQSGRLRNEVYLLQDVLFIINFDSTVLLKFKLRQSYCDEEISFKANDFEGNELFPEDGKIVFRKLVGGVERKKICSGGDKTFEEVKELFEGFAEEGGERKNILNFNVSVLSLLEEALSHIEFSCVQKKVYLTQRDIYSGTIVKLDKDSQAGGKGLFGIVTDSITSDFSPMGMRTNDFISLFVFNDDLKFYFPSASEEAVEFVYLKGQKAGFEGIVAGCLYDEMPGIENLNMKGEEDGREKQKGRLREPSVDTKADKGERKERVSQEQQGAGLRRRRV